MGGRGLWSVVDEASVFMLRLENKPPSLESEFRTPSHHREPC